MPAIARRLTLLAVLVASLAAGADSPCVFTDATGRALELERTPQRLLVIGEGPFMVAHLLFMFPEGRERMVGMERKGPTASEFLPLVDPSFATRSFLSTNPGPEQIAGLRPDLVLSRGTTADEKSRALAEIGIPVAFLSLETPERYLDDVETLGRILANPARAEAVTAYYRGRLETVREALSGLNPKDRPRVLLAMAMPRGGKVAVQVPARSWLQTQIVEAAGGNPVWLESAEPASGWTVVTIEQIARWNPDRIHVVFWHSMDPRQGLAELRADPHWAALEAVKGGRLRAFPADLYGWDTPDPRWVLGLLWSAATTHPGRFPGFDIDAEIERFYRELYGMDVAAVAAGIRPAIRMDLR